MGIWIPSRERQAKMIIVNSRICRDATDVVQKLIGKTRPVGETNEDGIRLENIKELTLLVEDLVLNLQEAANFAEHHEHSRKEIGTVAKRFLFGLQENLKDYLGDKE